MTGDSENEQASVDHDPAPHDPTTGENEGESAFRPFRAWASAYEPRESLWTRLRSRVASLFRRSTEENTEVTEGSTEGTEGSTEGTEGSTEVTGEETEDTEEETEDTEDTEESTELVEGRAVAPPRGFRFPWTRSDVEAAAPVEQPVDDSADSFDFDAAFDAAPAPASSATPTSPPSSSPSHFSSQAAYPRYVGDESDLQDESAQDQTFQSVDDALPFAHDGDAGEEAVADMVPAPETVPPKRGFFARLFRRTPPADTSDDVLADEESLEVEVHEDRIDAAADALDQVAVEQFESFEGRGWGGADQTGDDSISATEQAAPVFESVDEALPEMPDMPVRESADVGDLDAVTAPALDTGFDGEATLEIEEKTDEFEIVELDVPTEKIEEEPDTLEVEKKRSWTDSFFGLFRRGDTQIEKVGAEEAQAAQASATFLLAKFRAFYNEIIRFQHQKSEFTAGFATAIVTDYTADLSPDAAAETLSKRLSELLELQAAEARWMGGEAAERYPQAQYAMAALADEIFTYMEWEGQTAWPGVSIERRLYQSKDADVELFKRMDRLLKDAPDTPVARDLARVYLLVLAAGFQGKWRPFGLMRPIAEYRRRLYEYIYGADPLMLYAQDRRIFPDAVSRTLEGHAVSRFTAAQRWAAILVFLLVSYTVVAHVAWTRVTADLKDVTARIGSGVAAGVR